MGISSAMGVGAIQPGVVADSSQRPASPYEGQLIFQRDTNALYLYDGSAWVAIADTDTPPALQLIKTQTIGSSVAAVTVTSAFSSEFDQYLITVNGGVGSTTQPISMQLGPSSVSGYNANYNYILSYVLYSTTGTTTAVGANQTVFTQVGESDTNFNHVNCVLTNPNVAKYTHYFSTLSGVNVGGHNSGIQKNTGQYTDFTLSVGGTMTGGTIRVYGYRNS